MRTIRQNIENTLGRILNDWGDSILPIPPDGNTFDRFPMAGEFYVADRPFKGGLSGRYFVVSQKAFVQQVATKVMGSFGAIDEEDITCVLDSIINVASEDTLAAWWGKECILELASPRSKEIARPEAEQLLKRCSFYFLAQGALVAFGSELYGESQQATQW